MTELRSSSRESSPRTSSGRISSSDLRLRLGLMVDPPQPGGVTAPVRDVRVGGAAQILDRGRIERAGRLGAHPRKRCESSGGEAHDLFVNSCCVFQSALDQHWSARKVRQTLLACPWSWRHRNCGARARTVGLVENVQAKGSHRGTGWSRYRPCVRATRIADSGRFGSDLAVPSRSCRANGFRRTVVVEMHGAERQLSAQLRCPRPWSAWRATPTRRRPVSAGRF